MTSETRVHDTVEELLVPFDPRQLSLYRRGDPACVYDPWPLKEGKRKWGEFPLVVVREHYRRMGYTVLASEPRLPNGEGFILLSYPGKRESGCPAYTKMAHMLGTELVTLDALNQIADKAKIKVTGNRGGGDPDLFAYKPDGSERFFVEVKWKDQLTSKQLATFPIIRKQGWEVRIARIVEQA